MHRIHRRNSRPKDGGRAHQLNPLSDIEDTPSCGRNVSKRTWFRFISARLSRPTLDERPAWQTVLLLERQEATVLQFPTQMWVSTAPVVSGSDVSKHLVRVARRFAGTVDEMNSGAGRTPQRDVSQAFVVQAVIVKPSLHVLASCGAAVKYGSHRYALGRFSVLEARKPCAVASFSHM
jgi:hypothetical protein